MEDETSDILGTHKLPIVRGSPSSRWSFGVNTIFVFASIIALYVVGRRLWKNLLVWREKSYKLSMRRRHGIPDHDHRPFNVAYAAAMRARQENEAAKRKARLEEAALGQDHRTALPDQNIKQRSGLQRGLQTPWPNGAVNGLPGALSPSADDMFIPPRNTNALNRMPTNLNFTDRYNSNPAGRIAEPEFYHSPPRAGPSRRPSRKINISDDEARKRAFDEEEFEEPDYPKKSRVEGEELIDGDEDPEWEEYRRIPQRGSKRVLADEDENEDAFLSKRAREKRARKISLENAPLHQSDDMDIDDDEGDDEVPELKSISRGKKRDRTEAGSTFGGDDEDSVHEAEIEDDIKARRRRRKRRTVGKRKSDAGSSLRGKKRDRDVEEGDSDLESLDGELLKVSRKKRGKRLPSTPWQDEDGIGGSDLSMDESQTSSTRGRGRQIGDEWESNGVMFKIGPNGQRLRQALIKKARQKFNMPVDSQHPDREANLEVCVETWLTEDEFKGAKAQRLLAWQDPPKASTEPESPSVDAKDPLSPPPAGKDLLWRSRSAAPSPLSHLPAQATPPGTPTRHMDPYRQSIATHVGLRLNPFQQRATSGKRIASGARVASVFSGHGISSSSPSPGLTDSTNGSTRYKMFSKWEKQDLEARAMMKMREANMKKQAEKEQREKEEREKREKAEKEKKEKEAAAAKTIPTITITTPAEVKPPQAEVKPPTISFAPSTPSEPAKVAASKPTSFFGPPPGASAPLFTLGSAPPLKSEDKPPVKPATPQPPTLGSTFFMNSSSGLPAKPAAPLSGLTEDNKTQQPKPQNAFSFSAPEKAESAPTVGNASRPALSFGSTPSQQPQASATEGKKDGQAPTDGGSLLSRIAPSTQPQQPPSAFSFGKPAQEPSPAFANATMQATSNSMLKPKFDFGISNKLPSAAPVAPPTSSLNGALGNNKPASTPLSLDFKAPTTPASATSGTSNGTTAPKFSFPTPSPGLAAGGTNPFGGHRAPAPATAPQSAEAQTKPPAFGTTTPFSSAFGTFGGINASTASRSNEPSAFSMTNSSAPPFSFGGNNTSQSNGGATNSASTGFGNGMQGTSPSPFGSNTGSGAGPTVFGGGSSNVFGNIGAAAKPAETPKTMWSTTPSSTPPTAAANAGGAAKSTFTFGSQTTTPAANGASSPFSAFKFGDTPKPSTTPTTQPQQPATAQPLFGGTSATTTPNAFGFGAPTSTSSTGATRVFSPASSTGQQPQ